MSWGSPLLDVMWGLFIGLLIGNVLILLSYVIPVKRKRKGDKPW